LLGTHIIGGAYISLGIHRAVVHDSSEPEIAQFCILVGVQEDVTRFQISVQYSLRAPICLLFILWLLLFTSIDSGSLSTSMAEIEARDHLGEDLPNKLLLDMLSCFQTALDDLK